MVTVVSSSRYKVNKKQIKEFATNILRDNHIDQTSIVSIVFAGKNKLRTLANKYKQENEALPVLSFVYNEGPEHEKQLGEVLIAYPQAVLMAAQKNKNVDEMILRLVKHGMENIINNLS